MGLKGHWVKGSRWTATRSLLLRSWGVSGRRVFALCLQTGDEGVHIAKHVGFVGLKDIVIGVGEADDAGVGHLSFEGFCLIFGVAQVGGVGGCARLGVVAEDRRGGEIVGNGE